MHCRLRRKLWQTLFTQVGVGLHTGIGVRAQVLPAAVGEGRYFVRVDLPDLPIIPARVEAVKATVLSTQLCQGEASVRTVEHLLAALAGMGVDNARIENRWPRSPAFGWLSPGLGRSDRPSRVSVAIGAASSATTPGGSLGLSGRCLCRSSTRPRNSLHLRN